MRDGGQVGDEAGGAAGTGASGEGGASGGDEGEEERVTALRRQEVARAIGALLRQVRNTLDLETIHPLNESITTVVDPASTQ